MKNHQPNIFLTLEHLMKYEWLDSVLNFKVGKNRSNSVLSGRFTSKLRGRGLDFEESRLYVTGDDIRNIDWKVTAKTGQTHTKVFTEEKEKPAFIFIDQSPTMGFGSKYKTKSVVAAEFAAIVAYKILKGGDRIGGMVFTGDDYHLVSPKRGKQTLLQLFQKVVDANNKIYDNHEFEFEESFKKITSKLHNIITHDFLIIIISDFYRYDQNTIEYLSELSKHNDLIVVKIFDEFESHLPKDRLVLSNKKFQINLNAKNKKLSSELISNFNENYTNFVEELDKYGITSLKIDTKTSIENQLISFLTQYQK